MFFTALKMTCPEAQIPPSDSAEVDKMVMHLRGRLQPAHLERIATLVNRLVQSQAEVNVDRWWTAVEPPPSGRPRRG